MTIRRGCMPCVTCIPRLWTPMSRNSIPYTDPTPLNCASGPVRSSRQGQALPPLRLGPGAALRRLLFCVELRNRLRHFRAYQRDAHTPAAARRRSLQPCCRRCCDRKQQRAIHQHRRYCCSSLSIVRCRFSPRHRWIQGLWRRQQPPRRVAGRPRPRRSCSSAGRAERQLHSQPAVPNAAADGHGQALGGRQ